MLMENPCGWKCNLVHKHGNDSLERNEIVCEKQACHWVRCANAPIQEFLSSNRQAEPLGPLSVCLLASLTLTRKPAV